MILSDSDVLILEEILKDGIDDCWLTTDKNWEKVNRFRKMLGMIEVEEITCLAFKEWMNN